MHRLCVCTCVLWTLVLLCSVSGMSKPLNRSQHLSTSTRYEPPEVPFSIASGSSSHCIARQVNLVSRHGSRYPTSGRLEEMIRFSHHLQMAIEASPTPLAEAFKWLASWTPQFDLEKAGQLTRAGIEELDDLGERFVTAFPEIMQGYDPSQFRVRSTQKSRAGRSATSFAFGAWSPKDPDQEDFIPPFIVTTGPLKNDEILRFFDMCPLYKKSKKADSTNAKANEFFDRVKAPIVSKINDKIGFDLFTHKHLSTIWIACKSELSVHGSSQMCDLLDDSDILNLEIADDIDVYWKKGYGVPLNYHMSCPLARDVQDSILAFATKKTSVIADLRFAHAETVIPLLALLGLYKDDFVIDANMTPEQIHSREWRTSRITPYATNVAFVVYDCQNGSQFVSVFHNERLRTLEKCNHEEMCPLHQFLHILQPPDAKCRFRSVCDISDQDKPAHPPKAAEPSAKHDGVFELIVGIVIGTTLGYAAFVLSTKRHRTQQDYYQPLNQE